MTGEFIKLTEKQKEALIDFSNPDIKEICYEGGARAGKTFFILFCIINRAIFYPNSRHLIARFRFNHLLNTSWEHTLIPLLNQFFPNGGYDYNKQRCIITFPNFSTIWGVGLDDKERVEKIMGSEYNTIFINEATQISFETYQKLKTRLSLLSYSDLKLTGIKKQLVNKIIIDCNPRNELHWIYKYFILRKNPITDEPLSENQNRKMVNRKWLPVDNPNLSQDYLEIFKNLSGVERLRLYEGQWVNQEGLVYPEFQNAIIEPFKIKPEWEITASVDFGYTNPFVMLFFAYDSSNEIYYLFDEYYKKEKTVREHCKELRKYPKPQWIVADHDSEDRATMHQEGFITKPANKDILTGIQCVKDLLSSTKGIKLKIFRSCIHTIEEFSSYIWEEKKQKPIKQNDHAMDALRYWAMEIMQGKSKVKTLEKKIEEENKIQKFRNEIIKKYHQYNL